MQYVGCKNESAKSTGSCFRKIQTGFTFLVPAHLSSPGNTHTHPFNGPLSRTTRVSRYQKGKTNLDFTETRDSEWQWHQLGHMQVCTSLHASTPPLKFFYRPDALLVAQPIASKSNEGKRTVKWVCVYVWCKNRC